jgi:dihydroorotate dehydrogenase
MNLYQSLLRPLAFLLDPEVAHNLGMAMIQRGVVRADPFADSRLYQTLFGSHFANPVGLAAGFDKNAVALNQWDDLGFGFVEVGTITHQPQSGNPKPRLFRLPNDQALINRMGFNNDGAAVIAERIRQSEPTIPVGINLGKSRATPLADAAKDYQSSYRLLSRLGDYFVVNVSSPNTPGLRSLQDKSALNDIFISLKEIDASRPMFVKISPDLTLGAIDDVIEVAGQHNLTGIIATNTTLSRDGLSSPVQIEGGLSGRPLRDSARDVMSHLQKQCPESMIKIGVGGILDGDDLFERIAAGAHLCQIYTGWVYGGPNTVPSILRRLVERMESEGIRSLDELRGSAV